MFSARLASSITLPPPACPPPQQRLPACAICPCRNLKRYLHYLTRYEAHLQSLKLEEKQRTAIDMKIDQMIEQESSVSNYSWLNEVGAREWACHNSYMFVVHLSRAVRLLGVGSHEM